MYFSETDKHTAGPASGIVDRLHDVAAVQVFFRRKQKIDHELDHFTRSEVFPGFFVGLFCADPD